MASLRPVSKIARPTLAYLVEMPEKTTADGQMERGISILERGI